MEGEATSLGHGPTGIWSIFCFSLVTKEEVRVISYHLNVHKPRCFYLLAEPLNDACHWATRLGASVANQPEVPDHVLRRRGFLRDFSVRQWLIVTEGFSRGFRTNL